MELFEDYSFFERDILARIEGSIPSIIPYDEKSKYYKDILGLIDLTTLEGTDNEQKIISLCHEARYSMLVKDLPDVAAVCVYPSMVRFAKKALLNTGIKVASVAGAFPSGLTSLKIKMEEIKYAVGEGADEIDTVINRGKIIEGSFTEVYDEIAVLREICGEVTFKVILETGELNAIRLIRKASELAISAGADFIKTSTGKIAKGATLTAVLIMLDTIREYAEKTGKVIGIKPSGGIREPREALEYYLLVRNILGEEWLDKKCFRIGASSLAGKLVKEIT